MSFTKNERHGNKDGLHHTLHGVKIKIPVTSSRKGKVEIPSSLQGNLAEKF